MRSGQPAEFSTNPSPPQSTSHEEQPILILASLWLLTQIAATILVSVALAKALRDREAKLGALVIAAGVVLFVWIFLIASASARSKDSLSAIALFALIPAGVAAVIMKPGPRAQPSGWTARLITLVSAVSAYFAFQLG